MYNLENNKQNSNNYRNDELIKKQKEEWSKDHPMCKQGYCPFAMHLEMCNHYKECPYMAF